MTLVRPSTAKPPRKPVEAVCRPRVWNITLKGTKRPETHPVAHSGRAGTGPGPEKTAQVAAGTPHRRHPAAVVPRPPERAAGPPRGTAQAVAEREAELPYPQDLGTSPNQDQQDPGGRHPGPPPQGAQPTGPRTARGWGQAGPGGQTARHEAGRRPRAPPKNITPFQAYRISGNR